MGNSQGLVRSLVLHDLGIGMISPWFLPPEQVKNFVRVLPQWSLPRLAVHAVMPSRLAPKRVRLLLDFIGEKLGAM